MTRHVRQPPEQAAFDERAIPVSDLRMVAAVPWFRLYRVEFQDQFYPSKGSRLTPASGAFPCVYLGVFRETTVAEVWGDRFAAHRDCGNEVYVITSDQARQWAFLEVEKLPSDLRICDLLSADTRLATGLDSGTLYATDLAVPQLWAERIARHPAHFDGIRYRSRHTDEACLVLWNREDTPAPLDRRIPFTPAGEFLDSDAAYVVAGKIGVRLSFAW